MIAGVIAGVDINVFAGADAVMFAGADVGVIADGVTLQMRIADEVDENPSEVKRFFGLSGLTALWSRLEKKKE